MHHHHETAAARVTTDWPAVAKEWPHGLGCIYVSLPTCVPPLPMGRRMATASASPTTSDMADHRIGWKSNDEPQPPSACGPEWGEKRRAVSRMMP